MHSHEARIEYPHRLKSGICLLVLDLFPAIPQSFGPAHDDFVQRFDLRETGEIRGLTTLRNDALLVRFTSFLGANWADGLSRWETLRWMIGYREVHGCGAYAQLNEWEVFYELLADGIAPTHVQLSFIEIS